MSTPEFREAQNQVMPFRKYKGKTLEEIAETDEGLLYLDWLRGQSWTLSYLTDHLNTYLNDPTIKKELEDIT